MTAAEEEEEDKRIQEFRESIPKMCSQLRILTHFYQVRIGVTPECPNHIALSLQLTVAVKMIKKESFQSTHHPLWGLVLAVTFPGILG